MSYIYRMVQIPPTIRIRERDAQGREAAQYLENIVNQNSQGGWEFYRVDEIGVRQEPGCIAALLGARSTNYLYYVVTFRKEQHIPNERLYEGTSESKQSPGEALPLVFAPVVPAIARVLDLCEPRHAPNGNHVITSQGTKFVLSQGDSVRVVGRASDGSWYQIQNPHGEIAYVPATHIKIE